MQRSRLAAWMVFAGVLLLLASSGLIVSVVNDWEQANGAHGVQQLTVNVDPSAARASPVGSAGRAGLFLKDAELLTKKWAPLPIAYTAKEQTRAVYGAAKLNTDVFGVNGAYTDFNEMKLKAGASFGPNSVEEHSRVALVSATVAQQLFRANLVVGKTIELFGVNFTVIGVFDDEGSLLRQMSDDGSPNVLIPVTTLFDVQPNAVIETIQMARKSSAVDGGESQVREALRAIGHNPTQFNIVNHELAYTRMTQWRFIQLFVCGMIVIFLLVRLMVRQLSVMQTLLRSRLTRDNWTDVLIHERKALLLITLAILGMAACIIALWNGIRFHLYIPLEWVPEQIIDVSFYMEKLRGLWQQEAAQMGYVPSPQELLTDAANHLTGRLFIAGMLFGLPLFMLGARLWVLERVPVYVQLQRVFIYVPSAAVIIFAIAQWAGLSYQIEPLDYAVVGALCTIAMIHFNPSEGVEFSYAQTHS
ncbi:hypothetical protein PAECIP111891_03546 [Paenibacillus allorhizoplanae]|uniref:MacB-like periplasmic core domain-containing protein n=1 Tax=Paenibacillus allorhizoplanae TaxID=2905648 RepID=A0ABN8GSG2_9BACL|nr:ABC transporter permease [Paenibacillus allorhizoplanae]CAH1210653.1 hypothetical protein PAECIP111891_03546 [Paenibacillus allorhizoplanae]